MEWFSLIIGAISLISLLSQRETQAEQGQTALDQAQQNLDMNKDVAQKNYELSQEQFEYQKQLNETVMQREDTAFQRQVADLKAAGLSPLNIAGGSPASVLTSANAPQFDMSGINQAMSNKISAYNDYYNRQLNYKNFALQNRVQTAQAFTNLAELNMQRKKANLENEYLSEKLKWEKEHGFRDYDWKSILTKAIEDYINSKSKGSDNSLVDSAKGAISDLTEAASKAGIETPTGDFITYGGLPDKTSPYSHTLDNENYDNNRNTGQLLLEEALEKLYKIRLRKTDTEKNRSLLYDTDDYLKKHISKSNWLKAESDFIKYYLKYGMFEGHKKYFE